MSGCINLTPPGQQLRYIDSYTSFEPAYVDHIPMRQPKLLNTYTYTNPLYPPNTRIVEFIVSEEKVSRRNYNKIKKEFVDRSIYSTSSDNNCFTFLNSIPSVNEIYKQEDCARFIPIPYQVVFEENFRTKELSRFESSEIYLLELKKGRFLEGDRSDSTIVFPEGWEQGISKGISFNDELKFIIYWTLIW